MERNRDALFDIYPKFHDERSISSYSYPSHGGRNFPCHKPLYSGCFWWVLVRKTFEPKDESHGCFWSNHKTPQFPYLYLWHGNTTSNGVHRVRKAEQAPWNPWSWPLSRNTVQPAPSGYRIYRGPRIDSSSSKARGALLISRREESRWTIVTINKRLASCIQCHWW